MRLREKEVSVIKSTIKNIFGEVQLYLFGSRVDDSKKGGDIDLFVIAKDSSNLFEKKIKALAKRKILLHKPVDIVLHQDFKREIEQQALKGIRLISNYQISKY